MVYVTGVSMVYVTGVSIVYVIGGTGVPCVSMLHFMREMDV